MKFLLDANVLTSVGGYLKDHGHDVRFIAGSPERSLIDEDVLALALGEERVLITNDKDFGQLIFLQRRHHCGVILFRLAMNEKRLFIKTLQRVIDLYHDKLSQHFIVITDQDIRTR